MEDLRGKESDQRARLREEIAARLERVRGALTDEDFEKLVDDVTRITYKYDFDTPPFGRFLAPNDDESAEGGPE